MADIREVRGLQELGRTMDLLPEKLERLVVRKAGAAGVEVYRREIRAKAPVREDDRQMKLRAGKTRGPGYGKAHIGRWTKKNADGSWSWYVGPTPSAFYLRMVETGHLIVHGKALSRFERRMRAAEFGSARVPAHPFMRPAFDAKTDEAFRAFEKEARERLGDLVK